MPGDVKVPCETYARIVGYLARVRDWNDGKRQEFTERVTFDRAVDSDRVANTGNVDALATGAARKRGAAGAVSPAAEVV